MKKSHTILLAFSFIGLFSHSAFGSGNKDRPVKTEMVVIKQADPVSIELLGTNSVTAIEYTCFGPTGINRVDAVNFEFLEIYSFTVIKNDCFEFVTGENGSMVDFMPAIGLIPCLPLIPKGSITYLDNFKNCYNSPNIDDKWVWQYSVQYNC